MKICSKGCCKGALLKIPSHFVCKMIKNRQVKMWAGKPVTSHALWAKKNNLDRSQNLFQVKQKQRTCNFPGTKGQLAWTWNKTFHIKGTREHKQCVLLSDPGSTFISELLFKIVDQAKLFACVQKF